MEPSVPTVYFEARLNVCNDGEVMHQNEFEWMIELFKEKHLTVTWGIKDVTDRLRGIACVCVCVLYFDGSHWKELMLMVNVF